MHACLRSPELTAAVAASVASNTISGNWFMVIYTWPNTFNESSLNIDFNRSSVDQLQKWFVAPLAVM